MPPVTSACTGGIIFRFRQVRDPDRAMASWLRISRGQDAAARSLKGSLREGADQSNRSSQQ